MNVYIILAGIGCFVILVALMYYFLRDSPKNNLRWARKHHKIAEALYENGEDAENHYELAKYHREKAEKQMKGE